MGIGVWQVVLVFMIFPALYIGLPALIIWKEQSGNTLNRIQFAKRIFGTLGTLFILGFLIAVLPIEYAEEAASGAQVLAAIVLIFPFYRWIVQRSRDAGVKKIMVYLSIVPLLNIAMFLYFLFKPTMEPMDGNE